ncbi:MAG: lytic transglycosylase domain-containing protein [Alphaproteobacteria bacterium]|nr:lytic transglycosylase domain-containing protein [Alphaproteobacteria bacterium]
MRYQARLFTAAFCVLLAHPAFALSDAQEVHARSAFTFADRKDWDNARGHASAAHDGVLKKLITWQYLLDVDSGADFAEISRFIRENPDWPNQKKLNIRAEMALRDGNTPDADVIAWFGDRMPLTGVGKRALAEALAHTGNSTDEKIIYLLRDAWRNGDFEEAQEEAFLDAHASVLRPEDDISRIDRLLWEEKDIAADRILSRVSASYQKLFLARMEIIEGKNANAALATVPSELKKDMGLTYDLIRYHIRNDNDGEARDLLLNISPHVPYPERWWKLREAQVRRAIDEKNYKLAEQLLAGHEQLDGTDLADASWLKGWLMLEFLKKPKVAQAAFEHMYENVRFPVSKSRAGYWAARAAEKNGDEQSAKTWDANAAAFATTFYGQLSALKLSKTAPLVIPSPPDVSSSEKQNFEKSDLAKAVSLSADIGQVELAGKLLSLIIENAESEAVIVSAVELSDKIGRPYLAVRGAKKALQKNIVMLKAGYPRPKTDADLPVERALALAITRQESEFDPMAKSRAGAVGMMQLLPSTAKEVAKKTAVGFERARLHEPGYNMMLGSHYLSRLIGSYDGSYVMAIAAYNAGPGNVRKWVAQFGAPENTHESAIDWIEKIPFYETRNYVQRVLENVQVYRHLESNGAAKLQLGDDLVR